METAGEVVQAYVAVQLERLLAAAPAVRAGEDDAVHDARVVTRRLRAALSVYRPALDRTVTDPLRDELAELGRALGAARDPHVERHALLRRLAHEDPDLVVGPDRAPDRRGPVRRPPPRAGRGRRLAGVGPVRRARRDALHRPARRALRLIATPRRSCRAAHAGRGSDSTGPWSWLRRRPPGWTVTRHCTRSARRRGARGTPARSRCRSSGPPRGAAPGGRTGCRRSSGPSTTQWCARRRCAGSRTRRSSTARARSRTDACTRSSSAAAQEAERAAMTPVRKAVRRGHRRWTR